MAKRKVTAKETQDALREIDEWSDSADDIFGDTQDDEEADFARVRQKTKPVIDDWIEEKPVEPERPKPTYRYDDRKEFNAEEYDISRALVPADPVEYEVTPEETKALKKAFRPPKSDPVFRQKWNMFIHNITERDNFNRAHLEQLTVLCDLFVEYEILVQSLKRTGYTYIVNTVIGAIPKAYPEVGQLNRTRGEIRNYMRILGLLLVKDKSEKAPDEDEWE